MPRERKRQGNHAEICPLCFVRLANRLAATSHYRAHARRGELLVTGEAGENNGMHYALPNAEILAWWDHGIMMQDYIWNSKTDDQRVFEVRRWLWREWKKPFNRRYREQHIQAEKGGTE